MLDLQLFQGRRSRDNTSAYRNAILTRGAPMTKNVRRLNIGGVARQKAHETQTSSEGQASFCAFPATFHGRLLALARVADDNPGGAGPLRHLKGSGSGVGLVSSDRFDRR